MPMVGEKLKIVASSGMQADNRKGKEVEICARILNRTCRGESVREQKPSFMSAGGKALLLLKIFQLITQKSFID